MYPIDRRKIAVHIYSLLSSLRKTAILLDVGHTTIARWLKAPSRVPYKRRNQLLKSQLVVEIIETAIKCDPFVSTRGLVLKIKAILNIDVSRELVRVVIKRMGVTKKKARYYGVSKDKNAKKVRQSRSQCRPEHLEVCPWQPTRDHDERKQNQSRQNGWKTHSIKCVLTICCIASRLLCD